MALVKLIQALGLPGRTVYAIITRSADGYYLQSGTGAFGAGASYPSLSENATAKGLYAFSTSATAWNDGAYLAVVYQQVGATPTPASDTIIGGSSFQVVSDAIITLDGSVAGNATAIAQIPTAPLLAVNYTAPDNTSIAAIKSKTDNLPATPAAAGDGMSLTAGASTALVAAIWGAGSRTLSSFGTLVADIWAYATRTLSDKTGFALTAAYDPAKTAAQAGDAMALTTGERGTLASVIEGHLLNDADGQALLQSIVDKINATDVDLAGLSVSAIASAAAAAILTTPANKLATDGTGRVTVGTNSDKSGYALTSDYDAAKDAAAPSDIPSAEDVSGAVWSNPARTLTGFGTLVADIAAAIWGATTRTLTAFTFNVTASSVTDKSGYSLTTEYDAAKNAASQSSVNAIPTTPAPNVAAIRAEIDANSAKLAILVTGLSSTITALSNLDTELDGLTAAVPDLATGDDMQTLLSRLTAVRAALLDKLAVPEDAPGPVLVIPAPANGNLQTLWGYAKDLGTGWAAGDTVTITPDRNQRPNGYLLTTAPKTTEVEEDGTFRIKVDKGASVAVRVGNYYSKSIIITDDNDKNLALY